MAPRAPKAQYFLFLVLDIEKFGQRPDHVQAWLRDCLYDLAERAFTAADIDHRAAPQPEDRGDGMLWLLPGTVPRTQLLGAFVEQLRIGLRAHGQVSSELGALRLRVALHAGDAAWDGRGWVGSDLNTAFRLVGMEALREALADRPDAELALVIEDSWHRGMVGRNHPEIDAAGFWPVRLDVKEISGGTAWIQVPGHPAAAEHRPEHRSEHRPEHRSEQRPEHRSEHRQGSGTGQSGAGDRPDRRGQRPGGTTLRAGSGSRVGQQIGVNEGQVTHHQTQYGGSGNGTVNHIEGDVVNGDGDVFHLSGQGNSVYGDVVNGDVVHGPVPRGEATQGPGTVGGLAEPDDSADAVTRRIERARRRAQRRDRQP